MKSLVIAKRFCGPPTSANGGYFAGMVAALAPRTPPAPRATQPLSVRLKAPPPLDTALAVAETPDGGIEVRDGERLVGTGTPSTLDLSPPPPVGHREAVEASRNYVCFANHRFPTCFVCGVAGRVVVAAPWTPDASLDGGDGVVRPEFMWAALDCPGYYAVTPDDRMMLLAQFTAQLARPVRVGEPCVVVGWGIGSNGPKHEAGTALYGSDGELWGLARALWVEPRATR